MINGFLKLFFDYSQMEVKTSQDPFNGFGNNFLEKETAIQSTWGNALRLTLTGSISRRDEARGTRGRWRKGAWKFLSEVDINGE